MEDKNNILLYDGNCNFCNNLIQFLIKKDTKHKIEKYSFYSNKGKEIIDKYKLTESSLKSVIYIKNNVIYNKSTAVLKLLKDMDGFISILYILIVFPKQFTDFIYSIVAKYRHYI